MPFIAFEMMFEFHSRFFLVILVNCVKWYFIAEVILPLRHRKRKTRDQDLGLIVDKHDFLSTTDVHSLLRQVPCVINPFVLPTSLFFPSQ